MSQRLPRVAPPLAAWFGDEPVTCEPLGDGHINGTWQVRSVTGDFVLQQLSSSVFVAPERVAANQALLFDVVAECVDWTYQLPEPLPSLRGERLVLGPPEPFLPEANSLAQGATASAWRLCRFVPNTRTLQSLTTTAQARAAGRAFGDFQSLAQGVDAASIQESIAGFYQLEGYQQSLAAGWAEYSGANADERRLMAELAQRSAAYVQLPNTTATVIHGDCKVNNLLFAPSSDEVVAVLDLDTLMAGAWWLDFGDLVRSAAYDADGRFQPELYRALVAGFFAGRGALLPADLSVAVRSPAYVSYMLTIRFLTDHLLGDRYFKVQARGQNLMRAQAQFAQLVQLEQDDCVGIMTVALQQVIHPL